MHYETWTAWRACIESTFVSFMIVVQRMHRVYAIMDVIELAEWIGCLVVVPPSTGNDYDDCFCSSFCRANQGGQPPGTFAGPDRQTASIGGSRNTAG